MERIKTDQETDLLASQKLILASQQGYFPDLNRLTQSVSIFLRDNYTPALPINSPPGVYREGSTDQRPRTTQSAHKRREAEKQREAKQRSILLLPIIQRL